MLPERKPDPAKEPQPPRAEEMPLTPMLVGLMIVGLALWGLLVWAVW